MFTYIAPEWRFASQTGPAFSMTQHVCSQSPALTDFGLQRIAVHSPVVGRFKGLQYAVSCRTGVQILCRYFCSNNKRRPKK